jgi:predicted phosphohydrolase
MKLFAIGDLHLSTTADKPMRIFGDGWDGHFEKIKKDWLQKVAPEDVVLIAGDISWAMKLPDALPDLKLLQELPGKKMFVRGNHDYWWNGITKIRNSAPDDSYVFLQTDAFKVGGTVFVGSRGWTCPGSPDFSEQDEKLYRREAERFRLAFADAKTLLEEGDRIVVLMHYPPFSVKNPETEFTKLFEENGVRAVVFGHIHGAAYFPLRTEKNGVTYYLTACDKVGFALTEIK